MRRGQRLPALWRRLTQGGVGRYSDPRGMLQARLPWWRRWRRG